MIGASVFGDNPGDAIALIDTGRDICLPYRQLQELVDQVADELLSRSLGVAAILCRNRIETVISYLGCLTAGWPVALLDASISAENFTKLFDLYRFDCVFSSNEEDLLNRMSILGMGQLNSPKKIGAYIWFNESTINNNLPPSPLNSLLLPTSGSTGSPKFVRLTLKALQENAISIAKGLRLDDTERPFANLPLHYSYGLSILNSHLAVGATVLLTEAGYAAKDFWSYAKKYQITSLAGVPYSYQMLARFGIDEIAPPSLRIMTQAGGKLAEPLVISMHRAMNRRRGRFHVMYGQTEATARMAILEHEDLPTRVGAAGRAISGGSFEVLNVSAAGQEGEIIYNGPNVMLGYGENRLDLTKGDELQGCLKTGDIGHIDSDGVLYVTGRRSRFAKVSGIRVNLEDIENILRAYGPAAAVDGGERIKCYCEFGSTNELLELRLKVAGRLQVAPIGIDLCFIGKLPLLANGKIDYSSLKQGD